MADEKKGKGKRDAFAGTELGGLDKYMQRNRDAVRAERIQETDRRIAEFAAQAKTLEWAHKAIEFCTREAEYGKDIAADSVGVQDLPRIRAEAEAIIAEAKRQEEEAKRRAAEEKAEAERKAAEAKAAAERKAAEEKAAAARRAEEEKRRAAEEKAAAERKAAEEKAKQIREMDELIAALASAPKSRYWSDEVAAADKKVKTFSTDMKVKLKNLPLLDEMLRDSVAVREAANIDERLNEIKRTKNRTQAWANMVLAVEKDLNDDNRRYVKELAAFEEYLPEAYRILRAPQIKCVDEGLRELQTELLRDAVVDEGTFADCLATYDAVKGVLTQIDYDMGQYVENFSERWRMVGELIAAEKDRQAAVQREKREREAAEKRRRAEEAAAEQKRQQEAERKRKEEEAKREREAAEKERKRRLARERAAKRKKKLIVAGITVGILAVIAALVLCIAMLPDVRHWIIAILIAVVYIALFALLRMLTEHIVWFWLNLSFNICLVVAGIPLACISDLTLIYALGFAIAVFGSSIFFLIYALIDNHGSYGFDTENAEFNGSYLFVLFGGALLSVVIGLFSSGITMAIIMGGGIALVYGGAALTLALTGDWGYNEGLAYTLIGFDIGMLVAGAVFVWLGLEFSILAMGLALAVLLKGLAGWISTGEVTHGWPLFLAVVVAGVAVLTFFFMHDGAAIGREEFVIEGDTLVAYYGTAEVVEIPEGITVIGSDAFDHSGPHKNLKKVVISNTVEVIGVDAFYNCDALEEVVFGASVKTVLNHAFENCDVLTTVVFNDNLEVIGEEAFEKCNSLTEIHLPKNLEQIKMWAFTNCENLHRVHMYGNVTRIESQAFLVTYGYDVTLEIVWYGTESQWENMYRETGAIDHWAGGENEYELLSPLDIVD